MRGEVVDLQFCIFLAAGSDKKELKDVRLTDKQYKDLTSNMSKKERREFERRQDELRREREEDRLLGWLEFEDELDDM